MPATTSGIVGGFADGTLKANRVFADARNARRYRRRFRRRHIEGRSRLPTHARRVVRPKGPIALLGVLTKQTVALIDVPPKKNQAAPSENELASALPFGGRSMVDIAVIDSEKKTAA